MSQRTWIVPLLVLAVVVAGCGGGSNARHETPKSPAKSRSNEDIAKEIAKDTGRSKQEAEEVANSFGGDVAPSYLPDGWEQVRDGVWAGPMNARRFTPTVLVQQASASSYPGQTAQDLLIDDEKYNKVSSKGRYRRLDIGDVTVLGETGRRVEHLETLGTDKQTHMVQYYVFEGGDAFAISGATAPEDWAELGPVVERIMQSFERIDDGD